jgi:hypothetical protein
MSYRTQAAEDLVDTLQCRLSRLEDGLSRETDTFRRLADTAWLDATKAALHDVYLALPKIEAEAELVPSPDAEQWLIEEHMAGDLRDFPAVA